MKSDILHSVAVCLSALGLPLVAACGNGEASLPESCEEVALCLNVEQMGLTRSDMTDPTDNEKMHTVRVVVLHSDGTVEHNRHYPLDGAKTSKQIILKVKSNETKKIFLFANEESVTAVEGVTTTGGDLSLTGFFDGYPEGARDFETEVNKLYFAPVYTAADESFKPIPMSSKYEIVVPRNENFNGKFYVVRVATKFVVKFINWRSDNVPVDCIGLETHAKKNFLMAHLGESDRNKELFTGYATWMDWLKAVSDASDTADWLTDYALPEGEASGETYRSSSFTVPQAADGAAGNAEHLFYLPESKHPKTGATNGEQEYVMTIRITDVNAGTFVCPLTRLNALFRNTEVVVNVQLLHHSIQVTVDVLPYNSVTLDPEFGLPSNQTETK